MIHIETLRKAIGRKHPCDASHGALARIEDSIEALVYEWNNLPDELRLDSRLNGIAEVVSGIGDI